MRSLRTALAVAVFGGGLLGCATGDPPRAASGPTASAGVGPHGKKLYYFMVFSNATAGQEEEFNRWYDTVHAPVMIESGDFVWAQRFALTAKQQPGSPELKKRKYLVIFAVETDDLEKVRADAMRRLALPRNLSSSTLDYSSLQSVTFEALGPAITQKQAQHILAKETAAGRVPPPDAPLPPAGAPSPFDAHRRDGEQGEPTSGALK